MRFNRVGALKSIQRDCRESGGRSSIDAPMRTTEEFAMWFLMLGLLGVALKLLEVGFVAALSWWIVLTPFALAVAWWAWADASGYTKRKVVEKENARKQERIDRQRSNLGLLGSRSNRRRGGR